jgi:penicillin-binding protein 1C
VKTGTTKDYRDNWTVGFTSEYTVGVWVGNFSGSPMRGVSGVTGAGQIFSDVMILLHGTNVPRDFEVPPGLTRLAICPRSGMLPTAACGKTILDWFRKGDEPKERCAVHRFYRVVEGGRERVKVYESVPPEFRSWAEEEGVQVPPPGAVRMSMTSPTQPHEGMKNRAMLSILYPINGDHFKIDPVLRLEYQSIKVLGSAPEKAYSIFLRVDRDQVPFNPSGTWWTLKPGKHVMRIEAMVGNKSHLSEPVAFEVD